MDFSGGCLTERLTGISCYWSDSIHDNILPINISAASQPEWNEHSQEPENTTKFGSNRGRMQPLCLGGGDFSNIC